MDVNIISFHGLCSQGDNLEILVNHLESDMEFRGINVVTSQHDYPTLGVWEGRRKWARKIVPLFILKALALEYRKFPEAKLYVLCHSNATFGMMNALAEYNKQPCLYDKIQLDRLFLFGCVIPRAFDWGLYPAIDVTNFVGSKDRVSGMSRLYGMGNSGQKGFKIDAPNLTQHDTKWKHSDFVLPKNYDFIRGKVLEGV
jgi:hypothetical protein